MHLYNGSYYLSWGCFYARSHSVYGPFTYAGAIIDPDRVASGFRMQTDVPEGCCNRCADGPRCRSNCSCVVPSTAPLKPSALPRAGDTLQMNNCSTARAFHWRRKWQQQQRGAALESLHEHGSRNSSVGFAIELVQPAAEVGRGRHSPGGTSSSGLCIATNVSSADSTKRLHLAQCNASDPMQYFTASAGQFPSDPWVRTGALLLPASSSPTMISTES